MKPLGLICLLALLLASSTAQADSVSERFSKAKLQFDYKNFGNAIDLLKKLLYPEVKLSDEANIVKAREMLGLAYFYTGAEAEAREEFTALLYLQPTYRLDAFLVPPPAVQFFDEIWKDPEMKARLEQIEKERQAIEDKKKPPTLVRRIYLERTTTENWRFLAFMPFGIGQIQNGDTTLGIIMASTQGLALLSNIVTGSLRYALEEDGGGYTDPSIAQGLMVTQYVSLGVFGALWIYSMIDANVHYVDEDVEPFERVREEVEPPVPDGSSGTQSSLLPSVMPGGAGLQLEFRF